MASKLPTPLVIIQDSRYSKQDGWQLDDISLCSSGNIAISGQRPYQSYVCIYGSTVDNSDSRDKPSLLYHKQLTHKDDWQPWRPRYISFIKPNSTEIVTCHDDKVQVIDYNRDVVLRSRKVVGKTTCLSVSEGQIFIGVERSAIVNIYDNDLNEIKSIRLKEMRRNWPGGIAAAADKLYVRKAGRYGGVIVYSQDSGSILTEYTSGQYRSYAYSIAVNTELGLTAVLKSQGRSTTDQNQIIFYLLSENKSFLTINVEPGVSRIRISDQGRIVTGDKDTGDVKIYNLLNKLVTYDSLKQRWQAVLQKDDCKRLTNYFHLPKDQKDSILMSNTPTNDLLLALEERDIIYSSNVGRLIDAFVALKMNETYYKTANIYQENATIKTQVVAGGLQIS
ncbi:hypothetical protein HOLleu_20951 [Holothuria leucospilota]|uniref:Uncharacterized protein n=1 Tax=Holothuria leucospilota TaxID=206669 RepID=A0A9Q1BWT3_HOLLE|nr:hypothetical protein HOLleu_20951 [Holothuria leucospilota]